MHILIASLCLKGYIVELLLRADSYTHEYLMSGKVHMSPALTETHQYGASIEAM